MLRFLPLLFNQLTITPKLSIFIIHTLPMRKLKTRYISKYLSKNNSYTFVKSCSIKYSVISLQIILKLA